MEKLLKDVFSTGMILFLAVVFSTAIIKSCQQAKVTVYEKNGAIIVQSCNAEITVLDALIVKELDK